MLAIVGMVIFGLGFIGSAAWYFWPPPSQTQSIAKPWKHSLEDLYASDFPDLMNVERGITVTIQSLQNQSPPEQVQVRYRLHQDFRSNSDFVSLFVPMSGKASVLMDTYRVLLGLRDQIPKSRDDLRRDIRSGIQGPGVPYTDANDLRFSGRVFIYTLVPLTPVQIGDLTRYYEEAGMALQVRGNEYWNANKDR